MCLTATHSRYNSSVPQRIEAFKVCFKNRQPLYYKCLPYKDGYTIISDRETASLTHEIKTGNVDYGIHVFIDKHKAIEFFLQFTYQDMYCVVLLEVNPIDWVADDAEKEEAVYNKVKVIKAIDI